MSWLLAGVLLAGSVAAFDVALAGALPVIHEGAPLGSLPFLVRSALLAAGAAAWVLGVQRVAAVSRGRGTDAGRSPVSSRPSPPALPIATLAVAGVVLALVRWWPAAFTRLALEDGPIEDVTAALLILGAVALGARAAGLAQHAPRRVVAGVAVLALGYVVLGMEEISWGQRLIGFGTPEALAGNQQGEANLHNLATNVLEVLFYAGTTAVFVLVPLLQHRARVFARWPTVAALTPSITLLLAFAPATAMNYDMWNISPVQFGFWVTIATLVYLSLRSSTATTGHPGRPLAALTLVVCVATQIALLALGDRSARPWDVTEYRELCTAVALAWYALSLHRTPGDDDPSAPPLSVTRAGTPVGGEPRRR